MSRQEAVEQYGRALRQGRKCHKDCVLRGRYPYPQVLDEILSEAMTAGQVELGVLEIPTEQITGTKTAGRRTAFSAGFMPLMDPDTEFAAKWIDLCEAHLGDEGIRDPIRCFEYLGRFYVQEGNKRVSVLKSYGAPTVPAYVIRLIPVWSQEPEIAAYYDFLRYYQITGLYRVYCSRPGSFAKLQAALGFEPDHVWTEEERRVFTSDFAVFQAAFRKQGGGELPVTAADALIVWLKFYRFEDLEDMSSQELAKSLSAIWADVKADARADPISVSTETQEEQPPSPGFLERLKKAVFPDHLTIAFVSDHLPGESGWAAAHDLGRQYLEAVMGDQVTVLRYDGVKGPMAEGAMEEAILRGAQVIFATTPPLINACRKVAARNPGIRVLNCSVSMPYTGVRTYYSRVYEGKFITGAIAGAMCPDGRIGYVASSPIFGVPAGINAFALGAQLTNPRARILLHWSCAEEDPMSALVREGVELISNRDVPTPDRTREPWGLCRVNSDGALRSLASPYWHWGKVYVKLVKSMLNGGWDALSAQEGQAVNYWWGMQSGAVGVLLSEDLPAGVRQLVEILRQGVASGSIHPFQGPVRDQAGALRGDGDHWFSPEEILHMDWLCSCVEGTIPGYEALLPMARSIVRLQGVYRDSIPPEKEGTIL